MTQQTAPATAPHPAPQAAQDHESQEGQAAPAHPGRTSALLTSALSTPIHLYKRWVSPALPPTCRYYPSCSTYAVEALRVHGPVKGLLLGTWRVLRCNPWTRGGVDHVPQPGQWRYPHPHDVPRFQIQD